MARLPRFDRPGAWFHVMNRGIARRVVFPDALHARMFLACLALAVRRGVIEVHAFCLLPTHFHLLLRSPCGRLSDAMRRVQNQYVRWFNRRARRDGSLFRGRFRSRPVRSQRYQDVLVRYIEDNPVQARLAARPAGYPHGSAARQAPPRRPRWLSTWWVDDILSRARLIDPSVTYASYWGRGSSSAERSLVETRILRPACMHDDLDDLVGAAPERVRSWMEARARLADGGGAGSVLVDATTVDRVLARACRASGAWVHRPRRGPARDQWAVVRVGLLFDIGGLTYDEIAARFGVSSTFVGRQLTRYRGLLRAPDPMTRVAALAAQCLSAAHPNPTPLSPPSVWAGQGGAPVPRRNGAGALHAEPTATRETG